MSICHIIIFTLSTITTLVCRRLIMIYGRFRKAVDCLHFFTSQEWKFSNKNAKTLWNNLTAKDKELFCFIAAPSFSHEKFLESTTIGGRQYLLNDPLDTLPRGRRKHLVLKYLHYTVLCVLMLSFFQIVLLLGSFFTKQEP